MQDFIDLILCQLVDNNTNWVYVTNSNNSYKIGDKLLVENPVNPKKIEKAIVTSIYNRAQLNTAPTNFIINMLGYENQSKLRHIVGKLNDDIKFDDIDLDLSGITK